MSNASSDAGPPDVYHTLTLSETLSSDALCWIARLISPTCVLVGIVLNAINVFVWSHNLPGVAKTARYYYVSLAASESITLLTIHLFSIFLGMGVPQLVGSEYTPGGNLYMCKFMHWIWPAAEQTAGWVLVALTFERLFAVFSPLRVSSVFTARRTMWFLGWLIAVNTAMHAVSIVTEHPLFVSPIYFCVPSSDVWGTVRIWYVTLLCYTCPILMVCLGNASLTIKLRIESRKRSSMMGKETQGAVSNKELSAAITVIVITSLHLVIYIPENCFFFTFTFVPQIVFLFIAYIFLALTSITHCANFVVYFLRVPAFRSKVLGMFGQD